MTTMSDGVESTDGVTVALHDLGGTGARALFCHPTGFHGMVWAPLAAALSDVVHGWALDFRGHGDSTLPETGDIGWAGMGEDVVAVVDRLGAEGPLYGIGHSMGGAALVLAEATRPGTFAALWLYEPIVFPPMGAVLPRANPMAEGARRRKAFFTDKAAALANYAGKPPLGILHPDALAAYVEHGFRATPDGDGVVLKCVPEVEAQVYENGPSNGAFGRLAEVKCPVVVAAGGDGAPPARMAPQVAEALPDGRVEHFPQLSHFGPMEDPEAVAAAIRVDLDLG